MVIESLPSVKLNNNKAEWSEYLHAANRRSCPSLCQLADNHTASWLNVSVNHLRDRHGRYISMTLFLVCFTSIRITSLSLHTFIKSHLVLLHFFTTYNKIIQRCYVGKWLSTLFASSGNRILHYFSTMQRFVLFIAVSQVAVFFSALI